MAKALDVREVQVERGKRRVLQQISFAVEYGELVALIGPNGAGKTTLLETIAGFHSFAGEILLQEKPLRLLSPRQRAPLIAYVPQISRLDAPMAAIDVVRQGRFCFRNGFGGLSPSDEAAVQRALVATDTARFADRPYTELSYGERRRVVLARALATEARLIVLDEPSSSLDIGQSLALFDTLRTLASQGHAVVLVLHHLGEALRFTDRALLLHQGRRVALGRTAEVVCDNVIGPVYGVKLLADGHGFHALPRAIS